MRIISKLLPAFNFKLVISSIGVLSLILFSGYILYETTKKEVVFSDNGNEQIIKTHASTVEDLLNNIGINAGEHDLLSHDMNTEIIDGMDINYQTANQVIVTINGKKQEYFTVTDTVGEFLKENNLSFSTHDDVSHLENESIVDGIHIDVTKAFQVTINDGGKEKKVWTTGGTVDQILSQNNITYDKNTDDRIDVGLTEKVTKETKINIVRVEFEEEEVNEKIPYQTVTRKDHTLAKGKERIVKEGKEGNLIKKFKVTKENGNEVNRELIKETVKTESEDRIVAVGTKEPVQNLVQLSSKSGNSVEPKSGKEFYMTASAYTAKCNGCSGKTSIGINLNANPNMKVIAVDPNVIPLRSKVWVEGYGEAIAGDTGGSINGHRIDLHFPTKAAALQFGTRKVKVKIID